MLGEERADHANEVNHWKDCQEAAQEEKRLLEEQMEQERLVHSESLQRRKEEEDSLREKCDALSDALEEERAQHAEEVQRLREKEDDLAQEIRALKKELEEEQETGARKAKQMEVKLQDERDAHERDVAKFEHAAQRLKAEAEDKEAALSRRLELSKHAHDSELQDLQALNDKLRGQKSESEEKREQLENELAQVRRHLRAAEDRKTQLQAQLQDALEAQTDSENRNADLVQQMKALAAKQEELENSLSLAEKKARETEDALHDKLSQLESENTTNSLAKEAAERDREHDKAELERLGRKVEELNKEKNSLVDRIHALHAEPDAERALTLIEEELHTLRQASKERENRAEQRRSTATNTDDNLKEVFAALYGTLVEGTANLGNTSTTDPETVVSTVLAEMQRLQQQEAALRQYMLDRLPAQDKVDWQTVSTSDLLAALLEENEKQAHLIQSTVTAECQRLADKAARWEQHAKQAEQQHGQEMIEVELRVGQMRELVRRKLEADAIAEKHVEEIELAMEDHLTQIYEHVAERADVARHIHQLRQLLRDKIRAEKKHKEYLHSIE
ncbi:hypothetical protein AGDE_13313 [Angomonas deanei]|nr:hypothetical protein AGDE_13313 [Angomonas deanei]|eukprot:EPY22506.1 hypothetical protein AGDE_13313 [Angomonas deanei]